MSIWQIRKQRLSKVKIANPVSPNEHMAKTGLSTRLHVKLDFCSYLLPFTDSLSSPLFKENSSFLLLPLPPSISFLKVTLLPGLGNSYFGNHKYIKETCLDILH